MLSIKEDILDSYASDSNARILINVTIIVSILLLICYVVPYVYDISTNDVEEFDSNEKESIVKDNWDIVEEVQSIRERQKQNISKMSQVSSYGL